VGYDAITDTLASRLAAGTLAALLIGKLVAWWCALGSGTSGGTLAPILLVGATFGGLYLSVVHRVAPGISVAPAAIVVVAMAATFSASTRATFTSIVFAFELTRDYQAILPLIGAVVLADLVSGALLEHHLMTEKLARRGLHVPREFMPDVLSATHVADVITAAAPSSASDLASVRPEASLLEALVRMVEEQVDELAVVDGDGGPVGVVSRTDIMQARAAHLAHERAEDGWLSQVRRRGRAASRAESRHDPGSGAAPARY
jgi:hypothetical protein